MFIKHPSNCSKNFIPCLFIDFEVCTEDSSIQQGVWVQPLGSLGSFRWCAAAMPAIMDRTPFGPSASAGFVASTTSSTTNKALLSESHWQNARCLICSRRTSRLSIGHFGNCGLTGAALFTTKVSTRLHRQEKERLSQYHNLSIFTKGDYRHDTYDLHRIASQTFSRLSLTALRTPMASLSPCAPPQLQNSA